MGLRFAKIDRQVLARAPNRLQEQCALRSETCVQVSSAWSVRLGARSNQPPAAEHLRLPGRRDRPVLRFDSPTRYTGGARP